MSTIRKHQGGQLSYDNCDEGGLTYQAIKQSLRQKLGREWRAGERLPPIKVIARRMGIGQSNTHRAVQDLVREGVLISRPGKGTHVSTPGEPGAAGLSGDEADIARPTRLKPSGGSPVNLRGATIAVLRSSREPMLDPIIAAMQAEVGDSGAVLRFGDFEFDKPSEAVWSHGSADAVMLLNPDNNKPIHREAGVPLLVVTTAQGPHVASVGGYDIISADSSHGGFLAGDLARRLGYENIGFIGMKPRGMSEYEECSRVRLLGFESGLSKTIPQAMQLRSLLYTVKAGAQVVGTYLSMPKRPELLFAASDDLAVGFVLGAAEHGLKAGVDYAIIGFDGQHRGRSLPGGPLTTVDAPTSEMGRAAGRMLVERLADPTLPVRRISMGCSIFEGVTTRRSSATSTSKGTRA